MDDMARDVTIDWRPAAERPWADSTGSVMGLPAGVPGATPRATCAATGAKMSRPWKVRLTLGSQKSGQSNSKPPPRCFFQGKRKQPVIRSYIAGLVVAGRATTAARRLPRRDRPPQDAQYRQERTRLLDQAHIRPRAHPALRSRGSDQPGGRQGQCPGSPFHDSYHVAIGCPKSVVKVIMVIDSDSDLGRRAIAITWQALSYPSLRHQLALSRLHSIAPEQVSRFDPRRTPAAFLESVILW